jgi:hypothetical protein
VQLALALRKNVMPVSGIEKVLALPCFLFLPVLSNGGLADINMSKSADWRFSLFEIFYHSC